MTATLTVRMDPELKEQFSAIVASVGLDAPSVVRMLVVQTVNSKRIPLSLTAPNEAEQADLAWLDEARATWGVW